MILVCTFQLEMFYGPMNGGDKKKESCLF